MGGTKLLNSYAAEVSRIYSRTPKAVFAAMAVSALTNGGDDLEVATERVLEEWRILHKNGIVKQKPVKA